MLGVRIFKEYCIILFRCSVDDVPVMTVATPAEGFWNYGRFSGSNPWANGGKSAPFDQPVSFLMILFSTCLECPRGPMTGSIQKYKERKYYQFSRVMRKTDFAYAKSVKQRRISTVLSHRLISIFLRCIDSIISLVSTQKLKLLAIICG